MASGPVDPEVLLRLKGERGNRGNQGLMGHKGYQGQVGPAGIPGEPGRPGPEGGNTGQGDDTFCFLLRKLFFSYVFSESKKKWRNFIILAKLFFFPHQFSTNKEWNLDQTLKMDYWKKPFLTCPSGLPYLRYNKTHRCFLTHVNDVSGHQKPPDRKTVFSLSPSDSGMATWCGRPLARTSPPYLTAGFDRAVVYKTGNLVLKIPVYVWTTSKTVVRHLQLQPKSNITACISNHGGFVDMTAHLQWAEWHGHTPEPEHCFGLIGAPLTTSFSSFTCFVRRLISPIWSNMLFPQFSHDNELLMSKSQNYKCSYFFFSCEN